MLVALLESIEGDLGGIQATEDRWVIPVPHSPTFAWVWDTLSVAVPMKLPVYLVSVVTWKLRWPMRSLARSIIAGFTTKMDLVSLGE